MPLNNLSGFDQFGIGLIPASRLEKLDQVMLDLDPHFGAAWWPVYEIQRDATITTITVPHYMNPRPPVLVKHEFPNEVVLKVRRAAVYDIDEVIEIKDLETGVKVQTTTRNLLEAL